MEFVHVDVFSQLSLAGNGLTVIFHEEELSASLMQKLAQEFKQFETIFLQCLEPGVFKTRIFTVEEELDFAGHPILGAAAAIHQKYANEKSEMAITLILNQKIVKVTSIQKEGYYEAEMNQGVPVMLGTLTKDQELVYLKALNLSQEDLYPDYPMAVISTGLPYLLIPLRSGLERSKIETDDFEAQLALVKAKFVYLFDIDKMEGRTWDNGGKVEDVATGSAAGPMGAYLYHYGLCKRGEKIEIHQGRFVGRPSCITVSENEGTGEILVSGAVKLIASGKLHTF